MKHAVADTTEEEGLDYRDAELEGSGDGDGGAGDHHRNRRGGRGGAGRTAITASPGRGDQERLLRFLILVLHRAGGRPGFSFSTPSASVSLELS